MFKVTAVIQSNRTNDEPVTMKWYTGDSEAEALGAVASIMATRNDIFTDVLSVTVQFTDNKPRGI